MLFLPKTGIVTNRILSLCLLSQDLVHGRLPLKILLLDYQRHDLSHSASIDRAQKRTHPAQLRLLG